MLKKIIASLMALCVVLTCAPTTFVHAAGSDSTPAERQILELSADAVEAGSSVDLTIHMPVIEEPIACASLRLHFDSSAFELTNIVQPTLAHCEVTGNGLTYANKSAFYNCIFLHETGENGVDFSQGVDIVLTFTAKESAEKGNYKFRLEDAKTEIDRWDDTIGGPVEVDGIQGDVLINLEVKEKVCPHTHTHVEVDEASHVPATCLASGSRTDITICDDCGEEVSRKTVFLPATGHQADEETTQVIEKASCTTNGSHWSIIKCKNCDEVLSKVKVIDYAPGHDYHETILEEPTCTVHGKKAQVCSVCGDTINEEDIPASGHGDTYLDKQVGREATCEENGYYRLLYYCSDCDELVSESAETIPAKGHKWSAWAVTKPPTEEAAGEQQRTCSTCKKTETLPIPALAHTHKLTKHDAVSASCTEAGNVEYYECTCGQLFLDKNATKVTTASEVIVPAKGHRASANIQVENNVDPTCLNAGSYDNVTYCADCNAEIARETVTIAALGHKWNGGIKTKDATCTEDGTITYTCLNDSSHTRTETIPRLGHDWGEWQTVQFATCAKEGTKERVCKHDASHKETAAIPIDMTAHQWGPWKVESAATETEDGLMTRTCSICGGVEENVIPATGHIHRPVLQKAKEATCVADGNIAHYKCACGTLFLDKAGTKETTLEEVTIRRTGKHSWSAWTVLKNASCEEAGLRSHTCSVCGEVADEEIPATGHATTHATREENRRAATCEKDGSVTIIEYCPDCGTIFSSKNEVIPAKGHNWGPWEVTKAATYSEPGLMVRYCKNDSNHMESKDIPAIPHDCEIVTREENRVEATCETDGSYDVVTYCKICGKVFSTTTETIPAPGHQMGKWHITVAPTETQFGREERECEVCHKYAETRSVDPLIDIAPAVVSDIKTSYTYTGKEITPKPVVKFGDKVLEEGTHYELSYSSNVKCGTATITITGINYYRGSVTKTFSIAKASNTISQDNVAKSYSAGKQTLQLVKTAKYEKAKLTYKSSNSKVKISSTGKVTIPAGFTGKVTITITSKATTNYKAATKKITLYVPTKVTISSSKNSASKTLTVKWKKTSVATGYQVQYSTSSKFKSPKNVYVDGRTKVSTKIKKLSKGKTYYVRVRAYYKIGKTRYYSAWSKSLKTKVKK